MSTGCQKVSKADRTICSAPGRQSDRETDRQMDRQTDRFFSQSDRQDDIQCARQTEGQNDSMTVWQNSRAAKEPALV